MDMYQKREERKNKKMNEDGKSFSNVSINWYPGHMAKAKRLIKEKMNSIDVVFEVIDARMPYASKIKDIETYTPGKPRILIMTKTDLCDMVETKKWVTYYEEKGYKVVPLSLEENTNVTKKIVSAVEEVMKPVEEKRQAKGLLKRKTRILIVGIPNAGKSTLINRLVGKKATKVGNRPGVTKTLDWIRINDSLELLDTPGVLWPKLDEEKVAFNLASLTAIKEEILPIDSVVHYILKTLLAYYPKLVEERYGITKIEEDITDTLDIIGTKRGCLMRGGMIDYEKVYTIIISDLKNGLIKGITFDRYEENGHAL
ncbi:MAG: ribosome biogenesis GTPase YlqF [Bacilli bacterium]|nr:ribosome biogenesis GTPase YlqF [Bacilli bacterium]